jgi:hypothetical protein
VNADPHRLVLNLPEPPSLNVMIDLAKKRTRRSRTGGWMKKSLPVVYDQAKETYELECLAATRSAGVHAPREPWPRWRIEAAEFRLHSLRDTLELLAGLKWSVDWLVHAGFVTNDSPRELRGLPDPVQRIARTNRGVSLTIVRIGES